MARNTRWIALMVVYLGDLMIVLDVTIVGVALPSICEDLGFSEARGSSGLWYCGREPEKCAAQRRRAHWRGALTASASGSQLASRAWGAANVIFVVGAPIRRVELVEQSVTFMSPLGRGVRTRARDASSQAGSTGTVPAPYADSNRRD